MANKSSNYMHNYRNVKAGGGYTYSAAAKKLRAAGFERTTNDFGEEVYRYRSSDYRPLSVNGGTVTEASGYEVTVQLADTGDRMHAHASVSATEARKQGGVKRQLNMANAGRITAGNTNYYDVSSKEAGRGNRTAVSEAMEIIRKKNSRSR